MILRAIHNLIVACLAMLATVSHLGAGEHERKDAGDGSSVGTPDAEPPEAARAKLDKMPPAQREAILRKAEDRQKRLEERHAAREKREIKDPDPVRPSRQTYTIDPELERAWLYYLDGEKRDREVAVNLFKTYLADHPESPFAPEINYRIGALYSTNRNPNESYEPTLMQEYFRRALVGYGGKFSYEGAAAWASIVNRPNTPLDAVRKYYDWLLTLREKTAADAVYPIRSIGECIKGVRPVRDAAELELAFSNIRQNFPQIVEAAERNIFYAFSDYGSLVELARAYPTTELGRQANQRVRKIDDSVFEFSNVMDSETFSLPNNVAPTPELAASTNQPPAASPHERALQTDPSPSVGLRIPIWIVGLVVGLLVTVVAVVTKFLRSARARSIQPSH